MSVLCGLGHGVGGMWVKVDNFLLPCAGNEVVFGCEEDFGVRTRAVWRAAQSGVDDLLGVDPRVLVGDILEV